MDVFMHIARGDLRPDGLWLLAQAEESFARLEILAEQALATLLRHLAEASNSVDRTKEDRRGEILLDERAEFILLKFLVFLKYRNSDRYIRTVESGVSDSKDPGPAGQVWRSNMRIFLRRICSFLDHQDRSFSSRVIEPCRDIEEHCWRPMRETSVELTVGMALEEQEFIITDRGYGNLDNLNPYVFLSPVVFLAENVNILGTKHAILLTISFSR